MLIGYARVSTEEQNEARQIEALKTHGADRIYTDKKSGKNTDREQLKEMLTYVREGDTVITESISRIARSTRDLLNIIDTLTNKGVEFISLKESIDTATPQGKFMLTVFSAMAELERETILQRQAEGIAIAKEKGRYKGRKPIDIDENKFRDMCAKWRAGEITARSIQRTFGFSAPTFYQKVKDRDL